MSEYITVKTTVTLTQTVSLSSYALEGSNTPMTREMAIAYESGRDRGEIVESFVEGLEYSEPDQITVTHTVE